MRTANFYQVAGKWEEGYPMLPMADVSTGKKKRLRGLPGSPGEDGG